jgi:ubiquinone/menaquinone biosynthesis C-methylase UbiE
MSHKTKVGEPEVRKLYARIAEQFANEYWDYATPYDKDLNKFLSYLPKGAKVLDAGCGTGDSTAYFLSKGFRVEGVDASPEMLAVARKKVPKGKFRLMDIRALKYKPGTFDGVYSFGVLEHIPKLDMPKMLRGFARVLKPKGYLFINPPHGKGEHLTYWPFAKQKYKASFYTVNELKGLLSKAGFRVLHCKVEPPYSKYIPKSGANYQPTFTIARKK